MVVTLPLRLLTDCSYEQICTQSCFQETVQWGSLLMGSVLLMQTHSAKPPGVHGSVLKTEFIFSSGREASFPLALLDTGVQFDCMKGQASMPEDEQRIKDEISSNHQHLNEAVHSGVAVAALELILSEGGNLEDGQSRKAAYLDAIGRGTGAFTVRLHIADRELDTTETWQEVLSVLAARGCTTCFFNTSLTQFPQKLWQSSALTMLQINRCLNMESFPEDLGQLINLTVLKLLECPNMSFLPHSLGQLKSLVQLEVDRTAISELPESMSKLQHLVKLRMSRCRLTRLPESFVGSASLTVLDLSFCPMQSLPELGSFSALKTINLAWCRELTKLPTSLGQLAHLETINLFKCHSVHNQAAQMFVPRVKVIRHEPDHNSFGEKMNQSEI